MANPSKSKYANDTASLSDEFGTLLLGDQVARIAVQADSPFTIGVFGKWGSGKTSALRRAFVTLKGQPLEQAAPLREAIQEGSESWSKWHYDAAGRQRELEWTKRDKDVARESLCVWYSPWQHQFDGNPVVPLLLEIRNQFSTWQRMKKKATDINRRGGLAGLALIGGVIDAATSLYLKRPARFVQDTASAVGKAWRDAAPAEPQIGDGQRLQLLFEDAVGNLLDGTLATEKSGNGRLIVFIDDLDRCEERVVVELLEAIKLYLGSERCIFVLGVDDSAVLEALGRHWHGRSEDANREYLEKLFQTMMSVPVPRLEFVEGFVASQFEDHKLEPAGECAKLVAKILEPNPRKIKNFVNSACASWELFRHAKKTADVGFAQRFLLLQYLRSYHKPVWRLLERQPQSLKLLTKVLLGPPPDTEQQETATEQRMLEVLFFRAFAHVLPNRNLALRNEERDRFHGHLPLADAVELFIGRIDRKRSDEAFIDSYRDFFKRSTELAPEFLHLAVLNE